MQVLILNGSPRKNGKVSKILHTMENEFTKRNASVDFIDVSDLDFKFCAGCMKCRSTGNCIFPSDDAHRIGSLLQSCDVLVVGTPVYWGGMNGKLKSLFDRLVAVMMGESKSGIPVPLLKGKKALVVNSCTTPFPFNILANQSTQCFGAVKEILSYSGIKIKGKIMLAGTKNLKEIPERILKRAVRLTKRV